MHPQNTWIEVEGRHTSGVYPKRPLAIVRGEGARLWDAEGNEYIDCVGGQGAANLGHAHPDILRAITEQSATLISCPEIFYNDRRADLLERLASVAPPGMGRAFLCNSGTEAVEAALKFARASTGRPGIVAAMRGFHGRTMGALSATWTPAYRTPFEPLVPGFHYVPYNDLTAMEFAIGPDIGGVLLEVVQGEGGVHPADPKYLSDVQALCRERGALLILDEVQTGYGRTGTFFACQQYGISPDLMPIAKSMAGGLPMGACLIGEGVSPPPVMGHGSTFGGNPLACAAAIATIEVIQRDGLAERADWLGSRLRARLREIRSPMIREVRGLGLLVGIELRSKVTPVLQGLQARGVLALPAGGTVLRLLPPLVISETELETVVAAIADSLTAIGSLSATSSLSAASSQ